MGLDRHENKFHFFNTKILILLIPVFVLSGAICFIKFNTSAAAEFTDNFLRPAIGANNVIFLEKIFFNVSDKLQQMTFRSQDIKAPQFTSTSPDSNQNSTSLDLNKIPVQHKFEALKNEDIWKTMSLDSFPQEMVMAYTFVRPDDTRPYSVVTIAQLDMKKMRLGIVAGTKEPGGKVGNPGPGLVPEDIVSGDKLVAAFDGGFQYRDGQYGMIVGDKTFLPLQNDLGTIVGYKNGDIKIINYTGQNLGSDVEFVRQNCPILVQDGQIADQDINNKKLWGRTMTTDIYTWRTGLGITKNRNLLFAVGNNLTPTTLAKSLQMAGAQNAMQLDINPNWVRFNIFYPLGHGQYNSKPLTRDLKDGAAEYLHGYSKDFFYVYKK